MIIVAGGILLAVFVLVFLRAISWLLVALVLLALAGFALEWIEDHAALVLVLGLLGLACRLAQRSRRIRGGLT